jgi:hypothetical protein
MLKAALNHAFQADRVSSDAAWRKVKPFKRVDEAVVRYLNAAEAQRFGQCLSGRFQKASASGVADRLPLLRVGPPQVW